MGEYQDHLYKFQKELWKEFEKLVKVGAKLQATSVSYPIGINPDGLSRDSENRSYFLATELKSNPNYVLNIGEDLIVGTGIVEFKDSDGNSHRLEPDIVDLYWLAEIVDTAMPNKST